LKEDESFDESDGIVGMARSSKKIKKRRKWFMFVC